MDISLKLDTKTRYALLNARSRRIKDFLCVIFDISKPLCNHQIPKSINILIHRHLFVNNCIFSSYSRICLWSVYRKLRWVLEKYERKVDEQKQRCSEVGLLRSCNALLFSVLYGLKQVLESRNPFFAVSVIFCHFLWKRDETLIEWSAHNHAMILSHLDATPSSTCHSSH